MRVEVNIGKKHLVIFSIVFTILLSGWVFANGAVFGHSPNDINWSESITNTIKAQSFCIGGSCMSMTNGWVTTNYFAVGNNLSVGGDISGSRLCIGANCITNWPAGCDVAGKCSQVCIGSDCKTSWPSGISLPTCATGQVLKWSGSAWACGTDSDTRCDVSGICSQVCIGSSCKTSWPVNLAGKQCPDQAVRGIDANGNLICTPYPPLTCIYSGRVYSPGTSCRVGSSACASLIARYTCQTNGQWASSCTASPMDTPC